MFSFEKLPPVTGLILLVMAIAELPIWADETAGIDYFESLIRPSSSSIATSATQPGPRSSKPAKPRLPDTKITPLTPLSVPFNGALYLFDITTARFELISKFKHIKSASQHLGGILWATDPKHFQL
jgi:hypothetical protein